MKTKTKDEEVWGRIDLNYSVNVYLPLSIAHDIQRILAVHAKGMRRVYRSKAKDIVALVDYDPPSVVVDHKEYMDAIDAQGLTPIEFNAWMEAVSASEPEDTIIDPVTFTEMRKGDEHINS